MQRKGHRSIRQQHKPLSAFDIILLMVLLKLEKLTVLEKGEDIVEGHSFFSQAYWTR